METVLYELRFRWGDLSVLLIPLLVGMSFWAVSCGMSRAKEAGKDLAAPRGEILPIPRVSNGFCGELPCSAALCSSCRARCI